MIPKTLAEKLPKTITPAERKLVENAYLFAYHAHKGQKRRSGEDYIYHPVAVASILANIGMDSVTIAAALLHDVAEDTDYNLEDIKKAFGPEITMLVDGVTKLSQVDQYASPLARQGQNVQQAENLRKMFLAMINDVRVVLIKLADRLHNMRTLGSMPPEKQKRIATETIEIYAPLANRLGIWQMKWELQDLSFRYLQPDVYQDLASRLQQRRTEREKRIKEVIRILSKELKQAHIAANISGRPKHIYSIYRKMKRKGVEFDQIYDVQGVRVIVEEVGQCYQALGIVHSLWRPIPQEFDDYIANPKDNMYRSLHTAVIGPGGRPLEVQIRTWEMHRTAEYGIAAHWRYKEQNTRRDVEFEDKIAWLRQLMDWRQEINNAEDFVNSMKTDVFMDRVYVFTPAGEIKDLPRGATPIDFAYAIHTEVGHRCRGARVNGRLVALNYKLSTGDQVEIVTAKRGGPSRDWVNPDLGYTATTRARNKIRAWFKKQNRQENINLGREMLERELNRLGIDQKVEHIADAFGMLPDDLLAAIGYGDVNLHQVIGKITSTHKEETGEELLEEEKQGHRRQVVTISDNINVLGIDGVMAVPARCCNPLPGDKIVGYITRGRGITVHRQDCPNVQAIRRKEPDRLIEVEWGQAPILTYPVRIKISAYDRSGLLHDVSALLAAEKVNILESRTSVNSKKHTAQINATLEIQGIVQLSRVLAKIEQLPTVLEARRVT